jgi:L-threonylcarbamoyladenylate synthase
VGVESTIVDVSGVRPAILRLGGLPREQIERTLGVSVPVLDQGEVRAPGTLASHYAPSARVEVVTDAELSMWAHAALACGERVGALTPTVPLDLDPRVVVVGHPRDDDDYAHSLYRYLRAADADHLDLLLVVPPPATGVGAAVADRLRRASAPARIGDGSGSLDV